MKAPPRVYVLRHGSCPLALTFQVRADCVRICRWVDGRPRSTFDSTLAIARELWIDMYAIGWRR